MNMNIQAFNSNVYKRLIQLCQNCFMSLYCNSIDFLYKLYNTLNW